MKAITREEFRCKAKIIIEEMADISIEKGIEATVICAVLETELFCEEGETEWE